MAMKYHNAKGCERYEISVNIGPDLYKSIQAVLNCERMANNGRGKKRTESEVIKMLLGCGVAWYRDTANWRQHGEAARYMVDHNGATPAQVHGEEIAAILGTFDVIEGRD